MWRRCFATRPPAATTLGVASPLRCLAEGMGALKCNPGSHHRTRVSVRRPQHTHQRSPACPFHKTDSRTSGIRAPVYQLTRCSAFSQHFLMRPVTRHYAPIPPNFFPHQRTLFFSCSTRSLPRTVGHFSTFLFSSRNIKINRLSPAPVICWSAPILSTITASIQIVFSRETLWNTDPSDEPA